jgi:hypothetical protein
MTGIISTPLPGRGLAEESRHRRLVFAVVGSAQMPDQRVDLRERGDFVLGAVENALGDSRPSLEERYPSHAEYVNAVAAAAHGLVRDRLLLEEDVPAYVKKAQDAPVGK